MKKLLFSLIAISMFTFATAAGPFTTIKVDNNTGLDLKVDIGSRLAATTAGLADNTQSLEVVTDGTEPVFNVAFGDDYISQFQVREGYVDANQQYETADPSEMVNVDAEDDGKEFEIDNNVYTISFSFSGTQAIVTIQPQ